MSGPQWLAALLFGLCMGQAAAETSSEDVAREGPDCGPVDGVVSICGLGGPEDLALVPGGRYLVFSQMVAGGGLSSLDTGDDSVHKLFPLAAAPLAQNLESWGDPACTEPPAADLETHGIHLRRRLDGELQLLVVNHGARESVEFFQLQTAADGRPALAWRGCVEAPADANFNDVVGLMDGGFLVTHMFPRSAPLWSSIKSLLGFKMGYVYRWQPQQGFSIVPGTQVRMANGIELSGDERYFFLNDYIGGEVRKFALAGGEPLGVAEIQSPDNLTWNSRGQLLVASHRYGWGNLLDGLPTADGSPVPLHFEIVLLDPDTMQGEVLLERAGPPMGGATAAVEAGGFLYLGSYTGDRIIKVALER